MKVLERPLLLDENVPEEVVDALRTHDVEARTVREADLGGADDSPILRHAYHHRLVLVTQDRDFGRLAFAQRQAYFGVVYLRPGNLGPKGIVRCLLALRGHRVIPPFFLVVRLTDSSIQVRLVSPPQ